MGVLTRASGPREAARLSTSQIRSALRRGGRQRNLERRAAEIRDALRSPQLEVPAAVSRAFAASTRAAVGQISEINRRIEELEAELAASLEQHPDAGIYRSLPGLGVVLGARVLGEFGDDPERYDSAKSRRNYAGTSPLTVASGRKRTVKARFIRNRRLSAAADQWALCSLRASPGCRDFYDRRSRRPATSTTRRCVPSPTASSATCTAASGPAPATTSPPPGITVTTTRTSLLDPLASWGVSAHLRGPKDSHQRWSRLRGSGHRDSDQEALRLFIEAVDVASPDVAACPGLSDGMTRLRREGTSDQQRPDAAHEQPALLRAVAGPEHRFSVV